MKEQSLKNLKSWKPGESGNPLGRPKGSKNVKTVFEEAAKEVSKSLRLGKDPDRIWIELLKKGIKEALKGNFQFCKYILDRVYGQPKQPVEDELSIDIKVEKMEDKQERQKLPSEPQN